MAQTFHHFKLMKSFLNSWKAAHDRLHVWPNDSPANEWPDLSHCLAHE